MKGRRRYLYGSLGLLSLLGFVGVLTQERVFLLFFAFAVDFGHWFRKNDEMVGPDCYLSGLDYGT